MSTPKKCILCREDPPAVPDRNTMSRTKRICRQCHAKRLLGDLNYCIAVEANRRKIEAEQDELRKEGSQ